MTKNTTLGRVFLAVSLLGLGLLHFFYGQIRPIIWPDFIQLSPDRKWTAYAAGSVLITCGIFLVSGKKVTAISLFAGTGFFLLFLFGHVPAFLSVSGQEKLKYWTNMIKVLALSGGFLIQAALSLLSSESAKNNTRAKLISTIGRIFFGLMLLLFGLGHFLSLAAVSNLVPNYIPFKMFWTFAGGLVLIISAISCFFNFRMQLINLCLAAVLFIWLITLHLYYAIRFPAWQEGENFIGALTCLAFCGIALLLSQLPKRM